MFACARLPPFQAYDLRQDGGRTGDEFLADMEPVAAAVPYLTCVGNHERDCTAYSIYSPVHFWFGWSA